MRNDFPWLPERHTWLDDLLPRHMRWPMLVGCGIVAIVTVGLIWRPL